MAAPYSTAKLDRRIRVDLNNTLTSGITKVDPSLPICNLLSMNVQGGRVTVYLRVNNLKKAIAADAALGFGEHIFSYPSGLGIVQPLYTTVAMTGSCPTGLSATAGEVGLGTTIASGAVNVLGGTAAFENIMEGTTLANHVAATPLAIEEANAPLAFGDHGAAGMFGTQDASASEVKVHLNWASDWNQTTGESFTFGGTIVHEFKVLGSDFGVAG